MDGKVKPRILSEPVEVFVEKVFQIRVKGYRLNLDDSEYEIRREVERRLNTHKELVAALNGALVALKLGAHANPQSAIDYGMEVLARATPEGNSHE